MTEKTKQTIEIPIYSIPFSLIGNALLLTLSIVLIFFNETNHSILSLAYVTLIFSLLGIIVILKSLSKATFKAKTNKEA